MGIENEKPDLRFDMKGRAILKRDAAYTSGEKRCNLCLKEKLCSMKAGQTNLLNKRSEIISKCRHGQNFYFKDKLREEKAMSHPAHTVHDKTPSCNGKYF